MGEEAKELKNSILIFIFLKGIPQQFQLFLRSLQLSPVSLYEPKTAGFQKYFW